MGDTKGDKMYLPMEISKFNSMRDFIISFFNGIRLWVAYWDYDALSKLIDKEVLRETTPAQLHKKWVNFCNTQKSSAGEAICKDIQGILQQVYDEKTADDQAKADTETVTLLKLK